MTATTRAATAALLLLLTAAPAAANDTALNAGRFGPEPVGGGLTGPESAIAMVREHLTIRFGLQRSAVVATFTFRNSLAVPAKQLVGFPDDGAASKEADRRGFGGPYNDMGPMLGLTTTVDGQPANAHLKYGFVKYAERGPGWVAARQGDGFLMAWHAVPVTFPPGQDVVVERRFEVENGASVAGPRFFEYVTHTGGPWKGRIGELVANVTLLDGITVDRLVWPGAQIPASLGGGGAMPDRLVTRPARRGWQVLGPTRMRLHWRDFEPRVEADHAGFALSTLPPARKRP